MKQYSMSTLRDNQVINPLVTEIVRQPAYDYQLYPTAGAAQFQFFQVPMGQGAGTAPGTPAGGTKTYADTNMTGAGAFPNPQAMVVETIEIDFQPGTSNVANTFTLVNPSVFAAANAAAVLAQLADVNTLANSGWLEFFIGSKTYLYDLVSRFPKRQRLSIMGAIATTSATAGEVAAVTGSQAGPVFALNPEITLNALVNFSIYIKYPGAVATPSGFNGRIGVILDGVLYRNGQ